ncbi:MAG: GGDEF domain-containing protein [Deltaproteobacteria bacterium]|nr:GGDEF domain-containing protein [Deltaproteobacteria bacterium]
MLPTNFTNDTDLANNSASSDDDNIQEFNQLMESTYQLAKKLLPFMAKKRIPLTPYNYRLFFDYFLGENQALKEKLDEILRVNPILTAQISENLYHDFYDFVGEKMDDLTKVGQKMGRVSQDLSNNLEKTIDSTGHYRQILNETATQISMVGAEGQGLKDILDSLLQETKYALNNQSDLVDHMESTNKIIATLTSELRDQTRLANMDELTQLYNRRFLQYRFSQLIAERGNDVNLSLCLFDLDRFKTINDSYGHSIGDRVLILCAKILQTHASNGDTLPCRYGGEEFLVLCLGLNLTEASKIAESVRTQVEATQINYRGQAIPVTISCGVSQYRPGEDLEAFVDRADQALYRAKGSGRNRVVLEDEHPSES